MQILATIMRDIKFGTSTDLDTSLMFSIIFLARFGDRATAVGDSGTVLAVGIIKFLHFEEVSLTLNIFFGKETTRVVDEILSLNFEVGILCSELPAWESVGLWK